MDAIHYKLRENHQNITKAAYVVLGVNAEGYKDILGIWVGANESSKFWLGVLNELKSRSVKNVDLFCVDGLSGFREAINAVYPFAGNTEVHYSSDTFIKQICFVQAHKSFYS